MKYIELELREDVWEVSKDVALMHSQLELLNKRVTQLETTLLMMKNDKNLLDLLTGGRSMPAEL